MFYGLQSIVFYILVKNDHEKARILNRTVGIYALHFLKEKAFEKYRDLLFLSFTRKQALLTQFCRQFENRTFVKRKLNQYS